MKVQQFLDHYGIARNPFAEEDAQTDPVFQSHCIFSTRHPSWDKIFGNPSQPSTSIVFASHDRCEVQSTLSMFTTGS